MWSPFHSTGTSGFQKIWIMNWIGLMCRIVCTIVLVVLKNLNYHNYSTKMIANIAGNIYFNLCLEEGGISIKNTAVASVM